MLNRVKNERVKLMEYINLPIDAIATFNTIGDIRPLYFRIEDENRSLNTFQIQEILYQKSEKLAGIPTITFVCNVIMKNQKTLCELKFNLLTKRWKLSIM